jgi:hypothetical protein
VLRSDGGDKWYEHPVHASESAVEEALGCTLELGADDGHSNGYVILVVFFEWIFFVLFLGARIL